MSAEAFYGALSVTLPAAGREATVRCFNPDAHKHDDRRPSCIVNRHTGCWSCQGCGAKGGPYHAALALGRTEAEAMALVAEHDLDVKGDEKPARPAPARREGVNASEADVDRYRAKLRENTAALDRLGELRGWTREAIERLELGLDDGGRVTFPVRDPSGHLVGLTRYQPNPERRTGPKLKADPDSARELFPAPEMLPTGCTWWWLVEGEPDAVAGASLGLHAVSVPGAAKWRPEWAARFAGRQVVVCMDCDEPGRKAAQRAAADLARHAAEVRLIDLEGNRDDGYDLGDLLVEATLNGGCAYARRALDSIVERAEPVAGARDCTPARPLSELLDELVTFERRFVVMSSAQADVVALWLVHTHALAAADTTPYLAITSAEKRSGKSRLLEVLELLAARPLPTMNVSDAALFRSLAEPPPTVLFDEIDAVYGAKARDREDQRGMVNAGYRRGASVLRCVGDGSKQRVEPFPVFAPKALAGIGELPDTIADRSLPIRLERRGPRETVARFRAREVKPVAEALRTAIADVADKSIDALTAARPELPDELDDRAQDVSEPLLAIADLAGGDWPDRARRALIELRTGAPVEDESLGIRLLADVRGVLGDRDRISSSDLLDGLAAIDKAPWGDWYGKPLSNRNLARLLKPYNIRSRSVRLEDGTLKGFTRDQFESAFSRYLPPVAGSRRHNGTTRTTSGIEANTDPAQTPLVPDKESGANPHHERNVPGVPDTADTEDGSA